MYGRNRVATHVLWRSPVTYTDYSVSINTATTKSGEVPCYAAKRNGQLLIYAPSAALMCLKLVWFVGNAEIITVLRHWSITQLGNAC